MQNITFKFVKKILYNISLVNKKLFHHIESEETQCISQKGKRGNKAQWVGRKAEKQCCYCYQFTKLRQANCGGLIRSFSVFPWQCAVLKPFIMLHLYGSSHWKLYQPPHNRRSTIETCCGGSLLKDSIAQALTNLNTLKKMALWLCGFEICTPLAKVSPKCINNSSSLLVLKWLRLVC